MPTGTPLTTERREQLRSGKARLLGVSNVTLEQLQALCREARVRPRFVQNRCYAVSGWDRRVRWRSGVPSR